MSIFSWGGSTEKEILPSLPAADVWPRLLRRMAKSVAPDAAAPGSPPEIMSSITDSEPQIIELSGVNEECINQNSGVTFLTTLLETQTVTVTRTRPGAQTVTISIDGCLPSPMPFNAPTC